VLGYSGLRHVEAAFDLANGLLRRYEKAQDCPAAGLGDDVVDVFHADNMLRDVYTCQGIYRLIADSR
jgi:hypothetical protein